MALVRDGAATKGEGQQLLKAYGWRSAALWPGRRVEDTLNPLGHAARLIVKSVSKILDREPEWICRSGCIPLLLSPSIKAGLDID